MTVPAFVAAADLHLAPGAWRKYPAIQGDSYESLRWIVNFCLARRMPLVLLGDTFDSANPDSLSLSVFLYYAASLQAAGLPIYYVDGNHDLATPAWSSLANGALAMHQARAVIGGIQVYGLNYAPRDVFAEQLAGILPADEVLLAHQHWLEFDGRGANASGTAVPYVSLILSGDLHPTYDVYTTGASGQTVRLISPGSTAMQSLDEPPVKSIVIVSRAEDGALQVDREIIPTRPFASFMVQDEAEREALAEHLRQTVQLQSQLQVATQEPWVPLWKVETLLPAAQVLARLQPVADQKIHIVLVQRERNDEGLLQARETVATATLGLDRALRTELPNDIDYAMAARLLQTPATALDTTLNAMEAEFLHAHHGAGSQ